MKRILGLVFVVLLGWAVSARAQLPSNYMNMLFFVNGCATYASAISAFPPVGALCIDTTSGGMYVSNGSAFVLGGSEIWSSNGGTGAVSATTVFFSAQAASANATTETVAMELPLGPSPVTIRNLSCWDSVAPGAGNTDAFTVRNGGPGFVAVASLVNSAVTCSITGATATSCISPATLTAPLAAGSVITIKDVTTGTPVARVIGCTLQVDEF